MKITIAYIGLNLCLLLCCYEHVFAQKQLPRLIAEARYHIYADPSSGKELTLPIDSVHYGYSENTGSDIKYAYNNTIDTDKYPEMAYLPDPAFFDIYPSGYDTAIKLDNAQDTSSLIPKWNIGYYEVNEYDNNSCLVKRSELMSKWVSTYRYDGLHRLLDNYIYLYNKAKDSTTAAGYIQYGYDDVGRMSSREFKPIVAADSTTPILYDYDPQGRISEVRSPNRVVSFNYDSSEKTKVIDMKITEAKNVGEPEIDVRCSYTYNHGNLTLYKEEKFNSSDSTWSLITADTITYDDKCHVTAFKDGRTGLYHNYKIRYNTSGLAIMRIADESSNDDTRKLPDGTVLRLTKIECKYYYEPHSTARR